MRLRLGQTPAERRPTVQLRGESLSSPQILVLTNNGDLHANVIAYWNSSKYDWEH